MSGTGPAEVAAGSALPPMSVRVTRADLVRYAGAALDFNPIHWNEKTADEVGLPGVIAHGMLTMAIAGRLVTDWLGDPGALLEYGARFIRPVVVPNDETGALVELSGKIREVREDGTARVDVTATFEGKAVLGKAVAIVRLPA
ncbi:dehydratase [Actinophytocola xanthii]|uniref:Dehydratase n=2 Tax=Actinophytocola xanthii TaxID=1912961 RepID=A0A1Q8CQ61_9PSEU|nr:dehydratase [Actinophytocola xanthii]